MKTLTTLAASAIALTLAVPASAQMVLRGYDADQNGILTNDELNLAMAEVNTFATYDTDGDGYLSDAEYTAAFGDAEVHWGKLGYAERTFQDWDLTADGLVAEDEFTQSFLVIYDIDESGALEGAELDQIEADFGIDGPFSG
ncbi:hypothetical protein ACK8OR_05245 [Jannaschia sp. KMU-145]|uniref:hypothetical protein n=1 Tax=Jannaschia halovivens TaxID=3388667 RepID=UPI00396AF9EF